ncbi:hypothetical protein F2P44_16430 [Massilia sp. CCM 8695]|uniref:Uncharacterized protein n=1 Tax=Massilia frigida TaxID=2609281 RepID=A0ABX0NDB6_9BURK|nr:hypothetical protein [Massilia frigida]NHZ80849.1 hypothetical protein [Massilia frigida]
MNVDVLVRIDRFVDDHQPGWVECSLLDADGSRHVVVEKGPVVCADPLWADSHYPQPGTILCTLETEWIDERGRRLAQIDTGLPWCVTSTTGQSRFAVLAEQIASRPARRAGEHDEPNQLLAGTDSG